MYEWYMLGLGLVMLTFVVQAQSSSTNPCPSKCKCSSTLFVCPDDHTWSWGDFLRTIPPSSHSMRLQGGVLKWKTSPKDPPPQHSLLHLHILECQMKEFDPDVFSLTPNLRELHITHVKVHDDEELKFTNIHQLQSLYLNQSGIVSVNDKTFQGLIDLKVLNVSGNAIKHLSASAFSDLTNLEILDLSFNQIETVHPSAFVNLTSLQVLSLQSNQLSWLKASVVANMSSLARLHLGNNPWACYCGLQWLIHLLSASPGLFAEDNITCHTPEHLHMEPVVAVDSSRLVCVSPTLEALPENNNVIKRMHDRVLHCNATGTPTPSLYWRTPHGPVAHPSHMTWVSDPEAKNKLAFSGKPSFYKAEVEVMENGDLHFRQFRFYFAGEYTCVAENPAGRSEYSVNVTIALDLSRPTVISIVYGGVLAGGVLVLGMLIGAIRTCAEHLCCPPKKDDPSLSVEVGYDEEWDEEPSPGTEPFHPWHMPWMWSPTFSRAESPKKCVTPAEGLVTEDVQDGQQAGTSSHILEQLEDVRALLRHSMSRSVGRLRSSAQHVKESGSRRLTVVRESGSRKLQTVRESTSSKLQNIRSSSSQYISTIRESSSRHMRHFRSSTGHYMHRMRTGVSIGMESVKSNIQSIRELCGPGDIANTVSTVSVATDVDSQETTAVVKTITYL